MYIIYKHTNKFNGKAYIGYTKFTLEERWHEHVKSALQLRSQTAFHFAIRKYGIENWEHEVLLEVETLDEAKHAEIQSIKDHWTFVGDQFCYGYNMTQGGDGHSEGYKTSIQTRMRQSAAKTGKKLSSEHSQKISQSLIGRTFSDLHLKRLSQCRIGEKNGFFGKQQTTVHANAMKEKCGKRIKQLTLTGEFIKEFETIIDAYKETGVSHITDVCKEKRRQAGGYIWRYVL